MLSSKYRSAHCVHTICSYAPVEYVDQPQHPEYQTFAQSLKKGASISQNCSISDFFWKFTLLIIREFNFTSTEATLLCYYRVYNVYGV